MLKFITRRDPQTGKEWIETTLKGKALLSTPLLNKGTAFTEQERIDLHILGKLPPHVETLEDQLLRTTRQYHRYPNSLERYIYLNNLHDKNEVLFYKFILDNLAETLPMIYTPGVSDAVKEFSHEFNAPRGLYISYPDRDNMEAILENRTHAEIELIAVTDGERILGIGDQGIGGMDIPIAKLVVYSLCGVNPYKSLPIMLDVGTDNPELLNDPMYLGWRHPRIRGQEYDDFIDQFVKLIHKKIPQCFLHWEDFAQQNARKILEKYRLEHCTFNDDMQGTGVVTLAALLAGIKATGLPLTEHKIIVFGAGTAGVGIADQLYNAMVRQGIAPDAARKQFYLIDKDGLICDGISKALPFQQPYARPITEKQKWEAQPRDLLSVVKTIHPTILIGASTVGGAFTEQVVREIAAHCEHPIILPLSNPPAHCEAQPVDLINWTDAKALIATGSPFKPVDYQGKMIHITQCNNAYSFPGIGLGVISVKATQVTDNMLWAASHAISQLSPVHQDLSQPLLPNISEIPTIAQKVALAVAEQAVTDGVSSKMPDKDLAEVITENTWKPYYREIKGV